MKTQTLGRKAQNLTKHVFNTESSLTIKKGAPVALSLGTRGGYGVKSVSGLAAAEQGFFDGIAMMDIPPNTEGETVFGYYEYARVVLQSRAATTDVWATSTDIALGDVLAILTASATLGGAAQAFSRSAAGSAFTNKHQVIAAETVASKATAASSLTGAQCGGGLYSTGYLKVLVSVS